MIKPYSKNQKGAVAIEFAALFILFFTLLYAIIAYSLPMALMLSYRHISADAVRLAVQVDPTLDDATYRSVVSELVHDRIHASWLPSDWLGDDCDSGGKTPLPHGYGYLDYDEDHGWELFVCIQRDYDKGSAIIPVLEIGGIKIPSLATTDSGTQIIRGSALGHL